MNFHLPIRTDRLTLRRIEPSDGQALLEIYGNDANARYEYYGPKTQDQIVLMIESL